jgi:hypothetical protein
VIRLNRSWGVISAMLGGCLGLVQSKVDCCYTPAIVSRIAAKICNDSRALSPLQPTSILDLLSIRYISFQLAIFLL